MPTACPSFTSTIAFDFTWPQMRHASSASRHSSSVGARLVTTRQSSRRGDELVRRLHEESAGDLADVETGSVGRRCLEQARVLALLASSASIVPSSYPGAITTSACGPADHPLDRGCVDRPVERNDPSERRPLVALERTLVRGGEVAGNRDAARVRVLDDRARRAWLPRSWTMSPRGVGVVEVEVREREAAVLLYAVPPARGARGAVPRRLLVRVLPVAKRLVGAIEREHEMLRQRFVAPRATPRSRRRTPRCARTPRARARDACSSLKRCPVRAARRARRRTATGR